MKKIKIDWLLTAMWFAVSFAITVMFNYFISSTLIAAIIGTVFGGIVTFNVSNVKEDSKED